MDAKNWKLGVSTPRCDEEVFKGFSEAGIDCMEVSITAANAIPDWRSIDALSKKYGVGLWSYHLPFYPFEEINIATIDSQLRENTIEIFIDRIKRAADVGIKNMVIHPSGEPNDDRDRPELMKSAKYCLDKLAEVAHKEGATICVEDMPRTCLGNCSDDILDLISANDKLRVCFDTNHLLIEKNSDFIKKCGSKIATLHVSDYDFLNERHWLPYEGLIDWVEIVTLLEEAGYSGAFLYEFAFTLSAATLIREREVEYKDFYDNYIACINKKEFKKFSKMEDVVRLETGYYKTPQI